MVLGHDDSNDDDDDNADSEPAISEEGGRYRQAARFCWQGCLNNGPPSSVGRAQGP